MKNAKAEEGERCPNFCSASPAHTVEPDWSPATFVLVGEVMKGTNVPSWD